MKQECSVKHIWDSLSDFWSLFENQEVVSQLWRGYYFCVKNLYYQLYQLDLAKSIDNIPTKWVSDWEKFIFDDSTRSSSSYQNEDYPYTYNLPTGVKNVEVLAESPREVSWLPSYTSMSAEDDALVLPDGTPRKQADSIYLPDSVVSYNDRIYFTEGVQVDTVKYYPDKDYIVDESARTISFNKEPIPVMWSDRSIRDIYSIYNNFGCLIDHCDHDSYSYLRQVQGLWYSYWMGASIGSITRGITILSGLPFVETEGIVEEINTQKRVVTIGDHEFQVAEDLFNSLIEGTSISFIDAPSGVVTFADQYRVCVPSDLESNITEGTEVSDIDWENNKVITYKYKYVDFPAHDAYTLKCGDTVYMTDVTTGNVSMGYGYTDSNGEYYITPPSGSFTVSPSALLNARQGASVTTVNKSDGSFTTLSTISNVRLSTTDGISVGDTISSYTNGSVVINDIAYTITNKEALPGYLSGYSVAAIDPVNHILTIRKEDTVSIADGTTQEDINSYTDKLSILMPGTVVTSINGTVSADSSISFDVLSAGSDNMKRLNGLSVKSVSSDDYNHPVLVLSDDSVILCRQGTQIPAWITGYTVSAIDTEGSSSVVTEISQTSDNRLRFTFKNGNVWLVDDNERVESWLPRFREEAEEYISTVYPDASSRVAITFRNGNRWVISYGEDITVWFNHLLEAAEDYISNYQVELYSCPVLIMDNGEEKILPEGTEVPEWIIGHTLMSMYGSYDTITLSYHDSRTIDSSLTWAEQYAAQQWIETMQARPGTSITWGDCTITFAGVVTHNFSPDIVSQLEYSNTVHDLQVEKTVDGITPVEFIEEAVTFDVPKAYLGSFVPGAVVVSKEITDDSCCMVYDNSYSVRFPASNIEYLSIGDKVISKTGASTSITISGQNYTYDGDVSLDVVNGEYVEKFTPITSAVHVYDYINNPGWFDEYSGDADDNRNTCEKEGDVYFDTGIKMDEGHFDAIMASECLDKYFLKYFTFTVKMDSSVWFGTEEEMNVLKSFLQSVKPAYTNYIFQFTFNFADDVSVYDHDVSFQWEERMKEYACGVLIKSYNPSYIELDPAFDKSLNAGLWTFDDGAATVTFDSSCIFDTAMDMDDGMSLSMFFADDTFVDHCNIGFVFDDAAVTKFDTDETYLDSDAYDNILELEWGKPVKPNRMNTLIRGESFRIDVSLYEDGSLVKYDPADMISDALFEGGLRYPLTIESGGMPGKYILSSDIDTWDLPGEDFKVNIGVYDTRGSVPITVASFNTKFYLMDSATDLSADRRNN